MIAGIYDPYIVVENKGTKNVEVIERFMFNENQHKYLYDNASEYKARLKAKEIKGMGVERYLRERNEKT